MTALIDEVRASYDGPPASNLQEPSNTEDVEVTDSDEVDDNPCDDKDYISAPGDSGDSDVDVDASTDVSALMVSDDKDPLSFCEDLPPILSDQNDSSNEGGADDDIAVGPSTSGPSTSGFGIGNFDALNPSNIDETPSPVSTIKSIFEVGSRTRSVY
jgi:hypothetical protein